MNDFNRFVKEQLKREGVAREYNRIAPFYRLADQLILLRKQRGITQQELAEKAETTQAVISRLENVSVRASLETVVKLADAMDAVVELKLIPTEEYLNEFEQDQASEEACFEEEELTEETPGIVFFGQSKKTACQNVTWFQPDPTSFGTRKDKAHRKKQLEIA